MLFEKIKEFLTELDESRLIQLFMDGSSVNWNVLEKLDDYLTNRDLPETTHVGSFNQHMLTELSKLLFRVLVGILIKS